MIRQRQINYMMNKGFTLVELIVGVAVFTVLVTAVYTSYMSTFDAIYAGRAKIEAVSLANEQIEIARNLPYADVGISGGIPHGKLTHTQTVVRDAYVYSVTTTVRNIDDPFDGQLGGVPNDLSPADYKLVEISTVCENCKQSFPPVVITSRIAPKNLETASENGALFVRVFDANGDPVSGAQVHIENNVAVPAIVIDDVTNTNGVLQIVDAPPGIDAYEITVAKTGYSTDKTYSPSVSNPNPTKPHATVALQQVTQLSFVIDKLSTFDISSVTEYCSTVGSFDFSIEGTKLIGANVLKYDENKVTNGNGSIQISNIEWDTYVFRGIDGAYDVVGINPISPVTISPDSTQGVQIVVGPKDPNALVVVVKDGITGLPLSDVAVQLSGGDTKNTGRGFLGQSDWSGGAGQATSTGGSSFFSSDSNIEVSEPAGDLSLEEVFGVYVSSGELISSSFDTGSISNFHQVIWNPTDQPIETGSPNVRIQIAANNDGGQWSFTGPDGTGSSYYTMMDRNLGSHHDGNRYFRYRLLLDTASTASTPNISDVSVTYTSSCTPPGQVYFGGLTSGSYTITLSKSGYISQVIPVDVTSSWQSIEVLLMPN